MAKIKRLPDAELEIMNALWDAAAPLTAAASGLLLAKGEKPQAQPQPMIEE